MKVLFLIAVIAFVGGSDNIDDCKCWEHFKPEKGASGYYCRGEKHSRIFSCNQIDKPPICKCFVNEELIELDLGELNCLSVSLKDGRWCENKEEFQAYFQKHPEHAIYD